MGSQASSAGLTKMPDNPEIWKAAAMADQFDKMQKLPDPLPGAPTSTGSPATRSTPLASLPLRASRTSLRRSPEQSTLRTVPSSG